MDINVLDTIDPRDLGEELYKARRRVGMTQEAAAQILEVARTTVIAIEKGQRKLRPGELIKLARAYGRQVSDFVRDRPKVEGFRVQFRGPFFLTPEDERSVEPFIYDLEELCRNYLELESCTGSPLVQRYPTEYEVANLPVDQAAESLAIEERHRIGLGDGPIGLLRDILEQDVGLRIFYMPLPPRFSGVYIYTERLGGCIAVNSNHPEERRRLSLAHDYSHFLVDRRQPNVFIDDHYRSLPPSERFAEHFAFSFLMPASGLTRRFNDLRRSKGKISPADLCVLANYYGVGAEALTRRLEDLRLLPTGMWTKLRESGFKVREAQRKLGLDPIPAREDQLPVRYQFLAIEATQRKLISEEQLAHFLRVDHLEARRIHEELSMQQEMDDFEAGTGTDVASDGVRRSSTI